MSMPLLSTKITIPPLRSTTVPRLRLIQRLNKGKQNKLTLISASAGFGKTTLLSEWSMQSKTPVAWLALDDGDNDATRFWTYCIIALQTCISSVGDSSLVLLQSTQTPSMPIVLTTLMNDLASLTEDIVLVLDDYHVIEEKAIHESIVFLLDHLPARLHLFLVGRVDPPLPLSRLRVREHITELRDVDLRFTQTEAMGFLKECMNLSLSESDIAALEARTEGWIAGLQLVALSMQGRTNLSSFVQAFTGSHRFVLDYLMDEVLHKQPLYIQNFLLQTAILNRFNASLCEEITTKRDCQAILEYLERNNLFLVPLDDERQWYRYHTLFSDVLRARLLATDPVCIAGLHKLATQWYEQHNFFADAIHHALLAKEYPYAADLIEQAIESIWQSGELMTFISWVQALPEELVRNRLSLCVMYIWLLFLTGNVNTANIFVQHVEQRLAGEEREEIANHAEIRGMLAAIQSTIAVMKGGGEQIMFFSLQALEQIPEEKHIWRIMPAINLGFAHQSSGDTVKAEQAFTEAMRASLAIHNHYFALTATSGLGIVKTSQGKLRDALTMYQQAQILSTKMGGQVPSAGYIALGLGEIEGERFHLDDAIAHLQEVLEHVTRWGRIIDLTFYAYFYLTEVHLARKDVHNALQTLSKANEVTQKISSSFNKLEVTGLQVQLWLAVGNLEEAGNWAQQWAITPDVMNFQHETGHIAYVRICLAQRHYTDALHILSSLLPLAEKQQRMGRVIELLVLQAIAFEAVQDTTQAHTILTRALSLAEPERYVRLFINKGDVMQYMLRELLTEWQKSQKTNTSVLAAYVAFLLTFFEPENAQVTLSPGSNASLIEPLSEREMDVLRMVASGASNQDIADTLVITLSTVKKHVGNILAKLTVTNRTQAIIRARELRLL